MCKFPATRCLTLVSALGFAAAVACFAAQLRADVILPDLPPGSQYEIAFVTNDVIDAASTNISDYNNFVTQEANQDPILQSLGVAWHAIASTEAVAANVNAPFTEGVPIYTTTGLLLADDTHPLYPTAPQFDSSWYTSFYDDQFGAASQPTTPAVDTNAVWTGSNTDGSISTGFALGDNSILTGWRGSSDAGPGFAANDFGFTWNNNPSGPVDYCFMYALSSPITVVPEPATLTLLGSALLGLGVVYLRRRTAKTILRLLFAVALFASAVSAQADVLNMGGTQNADGTWNGLASLSFVTVGDPGNVAEPTTGLGSVPYVYQMGEYDVTFGQYCDFLNSVARTNDPYSLYTLGYGTTSIANFLPTIGITRSGSPGDYSYAVTGSDSQAANCPIVFANWGDAARFCNWLQNGQPNAPEGNGTTETGSYNLSGATSNAALMAVTRSSTATYVIPNENEWFKAAFYSGGGTNSAYWLYETQSNTTPSNVLSATGTNNANIVTSLVVSSSDQCTDPTNLLTPVGAFAMSPGPYGTYDMGGDVNQWIEPTTTGTYPQYVGGDFEDPYPWMHAFPGRTEPPTYSNVWMGFRVAVVPEPGSLALLLVGAVALGIWRLRRNA